MRFFSQPRVRRPTTTILLLISIAFVPMFLFASLYSQISLGDDASAAGLYIGMFFAGFVIAAQRGGAILDKSGVKPAAALGCAVAAVGFFLWGESMTDISYADGSGWWRVVLAGAGTGLILGPVSTDALNRVPATSYGEGTGITQTARNLGASVGLAILGTIMVSQNTANAESELVDLGCSAREADSVASGLSSAISAGGGSSGGDGAADLPTL